MSTKHEGWITFLQGVDKLYEHKFGHPPDGSDRVKAAHFITWRFGSDTQVLVDAIARIEELEKPIRENLACAAANGPTHFVELEGGDDEL